MKKVLVAKIIYLFIFLGTLFPNLKYIQIWNTYFFQRYIETTFEKWRKINGFVTFWVVDGTVPLSDTDAPGAGTGQVTAGVKTDITETWKKLFLYNKKIRDNWGWVVKN